MSRDRSVHFSLVALVLWIFVPVVVIAAVGMIYAWHAGRNATERELTFHVQALAAGVARELEISKAAPQTLATSPSLVTGDLAAFQQQSLLIPKPDGARIMLTDTSGQMQTDSLLPYGAPLPKPGELGLMMSQVFTSGQTQVSDLSVGPVTRDYLVALDVPVELDGRVAYGLTMAFAPSALTAVLDERRGIADGWRALVVDGNGIVLARSSNVESFIGRRIGFASLAAIDRGEGVFTTTSQNGHQMLAANARVPRTGWSTIAATRLDMIEADRVRLLGTTAATGAAMLLFGLFAAGLYARRITRPLHALVEAADALAHGSQPRCIPPGVREASRIGAALAQAAETLQSREQERARSDVALRENEARFRTITDAMPQMVWSTQADGCHDYYNLRWYEYTGNQPGKLNAQTWRRLFQPDDLARAIAAWRHSLATGEPFEIEYRLRRADGMWRWCLSRASPMRDAETGVILRWFGTCTDIQDLVEAREALARSRAELERLVAERGETLLQAVDALHSEAIELAQTEEVLRQAQKMEAVGQLTSGIAHDFNNMLQGISGSLELVQRRTEQGRVAEAVHFIENALKTVDRAAALTRRLLAFTRRQPLQPTLVNPNEIIIGMEDLIRRTVRSSISIKLRTCGDAGAVLCDPNQFENALLNLAINAGDAMPTGGRLTISARQMQLAEADVAGQDGASPGDHVEVAVVDTGTGMDDATRLRAFEPFFTTKPIGKGTGLGLSQIVRFARQAGGLVQLESELGQGTTVRLFLPRHEIAGQAGERLAPASPTPAPTSQAPSAPSRSLDP